MKKFSVFLTVFYLFSLTGCFSAKPGTVNNAYSTPFVESGRIINSKRLQAGGKVLVVPFSAGPNVEANEDLDKIALMIVRGILDTIGENHDTLRLVYSEQDDPDLVLDGRVVALNHPSTLKKWTLMDTKKFLAVEGKLVDYETGYAVVYFSDEQKAKKGSEDQRLLGLRAGQNIGKYILSGLEEERL